MKLNKVLNTVKLNKNEKLITLDLSDVEVDLMGLIDLQQLININLVEGDVLIGKKISDITLPKKSTIAFVLKGRKTVMPNEDVVLEMGDNIVISADDKDNEYKLQLREIEVLAKHRWVGQMLKDIDISRQTHIVLIRRGNEDYKPYSKFVLKEGDRILVYSSIKNMKDDYGELYNYENNKNNDNIE